MNLRNVEAYNIGLDIGTSSVGWAATDTDGNMCYFKGKPTWGSRLFGEASHASDARGPRGLRRRYDRRRQRLDLLQQLFQEEMDKVDPEFFSRLNQSRLRKEDKSENLQGFRWPLFNGDDFDESDYYSHFPTIYHLRAYLTDTQEKADIRLIYLALHNIVKHRGNFLQQENRELTSKGASIDDSIEYLCQTLVDWAEQNDFICNPNPEAISDVLSDIDAGKSVLKERLSNLWGIQVTLDSDVSINVKKFTTALNGAIIGASAELADVFFINEEKPEDAKTKIYLSKEEDVDEFNKCCPDEGIALFEAMQKVYSAYILQGILSYAPGQTISVNKVAQYDQYGEDLKTLKVLVRQYRNDLYDEFFRGDTFSGTGKYVPESATGYTKYDVSHSKYPYDAFFADIKKLFKGTAAEDDERYQEMVNRFEEEKFLRRPKTSDNGAIPFQLHLEEMHQIIENQSKHYPFFKETSDGYAVQAKIESLVTFRIPYYVGPLTTKNAARVGGTENGAMRFAWSVRKEGKENTAIKPWNWDEVIDKDASAENFILRMTGTCTYIQGEPVLPKSSLLYEEFCVFNELNGAKYTQDGDKKYRLDYLDRIAIVDQLFKKGSVSYKKVEDWLSANGRLNPHVSGGQGEKGFESKLSSYLFFKKVLNVDVIDSSDYEMLEELILWSTIFEDRDIFERKIKAKYSDRLNSEQIKAIKKKRFTGWGKLSRKFLEGMKVESDSGMVSIMDVLRQGNPNYGHKSETMVLMQVLTDEELGFDKALDAENKSRMTGGKLKLEDLPGSPNLRRGINQALRIVDEIAKIAGKPPANIFIEVTRDEDEANKGKRTNKRYDALKVALKNLKEQNPEFIGGELFGEFKNTDSKNLDERITLYFMQGGKSLYSGKTLDINRLSEYQVDHILPQSYIKDDSFENKALVLSDENQRKSDELLLPYDMRHSMKGYWDALHSAGLIGDKKYRNLNRDHISEKQMKGFIQRQLVETSQVIKLTQMFLSESYPNTSVIPVKAALSSQLKARIGIYKCREANDFHHAHDALLACAMGRFIEVRFPDINKNPVKFAKMVKEYIRNQSDVLKKEHRMPGDSTFIVSSFLHSGFDKQTGEIFRDTWDAQEEIARLKKYVNYKQCFITRMVEEETGAFWDQTIYSPRDKKKKDQLRLPLKKGLDPKVYGSYSREQSAYFFIFEAIKKNKHVLEFAPVPRCVAKRIDGNKDALRSYAEELAVEAGEEFVAIVKPKIYKYQLVEFDGSRFYLTGNREVRNAIQVALSQENIKTLSDVLEGADVFDEDYVKLFEAVAKSVISYSPKIASSIKLNNLKEKINHLDKQAKSDVVTAVLNLTNAKTNMIDLTAVGSSKFAGQLHPTFSKILTTGEGMVFVNQSITGMFESSEHIGL